VEEFIGPDAYSYVFDGQLGYLDTALATRSMLNWVTGTTIFHINADEPDILDYDMTFKSDYQDTLFEPLPYRVSDHDPVIIGLTFGGPGKGK
jgi:predicted extracellular nuclease